MTYNDDAKWVRSALRACYDSDLVAAFERLMEPLGLSIASDERCDECAAALHDGKTCCANGTCRHQACARERVKAKRAAVLALER